MAFPTGQRYTGFANRTEVIAYLAKLKVSDLKILCERYNADYQNLEGDSKREKMATFVTALPQTGDKGFLALLRKLR